MNNENRKISQNRKRRIARRDKMSDEMKSFSNKSKTEKKRKNKKSIKIKN